MAEEKVKAVDKSNEIKLSKTVLVKVGTYVLVFVLGGGLGYIVADHFPLKFAGTKRVFNTRGYGMMSGGFDQDDRGGSGLRGGMMGVRGGNRAGGEVTKIDGNTITIKLPNGNTETITVNDSTVYKKTTTGSKSDVKVGDTISVTGVDTADDTVSQITIR